MYIQKNFLDALYTSGGAIFSYPYNIDTQDKTIKLPLPSPETYTDMVWFENYESVTANTKLDDTVAHLETLKEGTNFYAILFLVEREDIK